jgi:hypothetical protein
MIIAKGNQGCPGSGKLTDGFQAEFIIFCGFPILIKLAF